MSIKRRSFLGAGAATLGLTAYSLHRGVRIPPLIWEPKQLAQKFTQDGVQFSKTGLITTLTPAVAVDASQQFRAFAPEPELRITSSEQTELLITVNNISPQAQLLVEAPTTVRVEEQKIGITRVLTINAGVQDVIWLRWQLATDKGFRFAAIGDTGGKQELEWCIQRAHDLGALFLLHLGDFYYQPGDYESSISAFNSAPLPCYVSIGNHDFRDGETLVNKFLDDIGPLNASFSLGGARFINVDTASNFIPFGGGQRGTMLRSLAGQAAAVSNIAFSHRPLFDPIEGSSHDIGNSAERDWLINALRNCSVETLISGHIHIYARETIGDLDNIIVGQGLGHQDLITNRDYSKIALGKIDDGGQLDMSFPNLAMPWGRHCHPRSDVVKKSLEEAEHAPRIASLKETCDSSD